MLVLSLFIIVVYSWPWLAWDERLGGHFVFDGVMFLKDGRKLGYSESGLRGDYPVVLFHGTPGARFQAFAHLATRESSGLRVVVPERPGYGLSDVQGHRTLFHHVADIQRLAEGLGIRRFSIVGISGGSAYALACAHKLRDAVDRVAIIAGTGPLCEPELLAASGELEQALVMNTEAGAAYAAGMVSAAGNDPDRVVQAIYDGLSAVDRQHIGESMLSVYRDMLAEALRIPDGILDDYKVLATAWGFPLEEIRVPVHFWHSTQDETVSIRHAEYVAAKIPNAKLHRLTDTGHLATPFASAAAVLEYLKAGDLM